MHALSPPPLSTTSAMDAANSTNLLRSTSFPPRPPSIPSDPPPPPAAAFPFPPTLTPSALLQRRSRAKQGLYPVDTPASGPTDNARDPSPASSSSADVEDPSPPPADRKPLTAYEILQVRPSASLQEISESFRRLVLQHHPDKASANNKEASSQLFIQLHAAYKKLQDPQSRARYDLELAFQASPAVVTTDVRKPQFCTPSPRIFATRNQSFTPRTTASDYTPHSQRYTPRSSGNATPTFTPTPRFTPHPSGSGRNWETDQCW